MANQPIDVVILKDAAGDYYVLPREGLEQAKVPPEQKDEVEKLIEQGSGGGELSPEQLESVTGGIAIIANEPISSELGNTLGSHLNQWSQDPGTGELKR